MSDEKRQELCNHNFCGIAHYTLLDGSILSLWERENEKSALEDELYNSNTGTPSDMPDPSTVEHKVDKKLLNALENIVLAWEGMSEALPILKRDAVYIEAIQLLNKIKSKQDKRKEG